MKTFALRVLIVLTSIFGTMFLCINYEMSNMSSVLVLVGILCVCCAIIYSCLKNRSAEEIHEILGLKWLENKTGINFTEE